MAGRALRAPFFKVVKQGRTVDRVTRSAVAGSRTITDLVDGDAVAAAYAEGSTLVLQSLHRMWPPVGALCRSLAGELGHQTQCNAYVTPAGSARGFDFHHDTHDVFVLQVEGSKHWQVHAPVIELPVKSQPRSGAGLVPDGQAPVLDVVLHPGDCLYLPRGFVHAAETTDKPSVHLTIGIVTTTWHDVLADALGTFGPDDLTLRRALPVRAAGPVDAAAEAADLLKRATDWLASLDPAAVAGLLEQRLARAEPMEPLGVMAQAAAAAGLGPHTPLRPRQGIGAAIAVRGDRVELTSRAATLSLPAVATRLLAAALAGPGTPETYVAGDADCDVADALVVVRRLLREGVLVAGA